jgi:hypothetical protein
MTNLIEIHDRQNEEYISAKTRLYEASKQSLNAELKSIANDRLNKLSETIAEIKVKGTKYVETVDTFVSLFDDVINECVILTNRRAEIEEKIIEICKQAIQKSTAKRNAKNEHVTARFIDCLDAEPSAEISREMAAALLDVTNPLRLGLSLYVDFCEKNSQFAEIESLDYLKTETKIREGLVNGSDEDVLKGFEKLLLSPIDCPEKYLLLSLNSFYHGFESDAANVLKIGLHKFPDNERLLSARDELGG